MAPFKLPKIAPKSTEEKKPIEEKVGRPTKSAVAPLAANSGEIKMTVKRVCGSVTHFHVNGSKKSADRGKGTVGAFDNIYVSHSYLDENGVADDGKSPDVDVYVSVRVVPRKKAK